MTDQTYTAPDDTPYDVTINDPDEDADVVETKDEADYKDVEPEDALK